MSLIRNTDKAGRVIDFTGLNRSDTMAKDSVYCSDIDGVMEFSDKYLIIFEIKEKGQIIRLGQRLLFERLADAWTKSGTDKKAMVLFATHNPKLINEIPVEECVVEKAYYSGQWVDRNEPLVSALHQIGENWNIKKLKKR